MWQPISTAPKGYATVLLFSPALMKPFDGFWSDELDGWVESMSDDDTIEAVTHWMPLPNVPPPDCVDCNGDPCWETEDDQLWLVFNPANWARLPESERDRVKSCAAAGSPAWPAYPTEALAPRNC